MKPSLLCVILLVGAVLISGCAGQAGQELGGGLTPAGDLTGKWSGTASFQENVEGAECLFGGTFVLTLNQQGNSVSGGFVFTQTSLEQTRVSTGSLIPPIGCAGPAGGITRGAVSGTVSGSAIELSSGRGKLFSGSFTSDLMELRLDRCLVQEEGCTLADSAKWKIALMRQ